MTNEITSFDFNGAAVRVVMQDGEPWWVAADVCKVLELTDGRKSVELLDEDERNIIPVIDALGREQNSYIISEAGLYSLILRSRKPEAKAFKRWVTHEVLPTIRKHGGYLTDEKIDELVQNPDLLIKLATDLKAERERRAALEAENAKNAPKVLFADSVASSHTDILIGDLAKLLKQNGVDIGQKRLFAWLRDHEYLIKQQGTSWNMPTQKAMDMGLFRVKERTIDNHDGSIRITRTTKVTGKGQIYFIDKFLGEKKEAA